MKNEPIIEPRLELDNILFETAVQCINAFGDMNPKYYATIHFDLKRFVIRIVKFILDYLLKHGCKAAHSVTARITELGRRTIYNIEKKSC